MAEDLVDAGRARAAGRRAAVVHRRRSRSSAPPAITPAGTSATRLASSTGLDVARVERLLDRYGDRIDDLADADRASGPSWPQPLEGAHEYLGVEVVYACTHEGALRLEDVLARRTRISFETRDRGVDCAPAVAELMAGALGWDAARAASEARGLAPAHRGRARGRAAVRRRVGERRRRWPRREPRRARARPGHVEHALHRVRRRAARARPRQRARRLLVPRRGPRRAGSRGTRRVGARGDRRRARRGAASPPTTSQRSRSRTRPRPS